MKIYFTAAVKNKDQLGEYYGRIVKAAEENGFTVHADHILNASLDSVLGEDEKYLKKYYKQMVKKIKGSDLVVAEVSYPSTVNIGHEISLALEAGKPILALHLKGKMPVLFWGLESEKFYVEEYSESDLEKVVKYSLDGLKDQQDTRFNFFISPKIANYLDWISKTKRLPRAVYLRNLIQNKMDDDKEYND